MHITVNSNVVIKFNVDKKLNHGNAGKTGLHAQIQSFRIGA